MAVVTGATCSATCAVAVTTVPSATAVLIQVGDDLARPVDGNMVVLVEVDQLRLQRRAVLHRLGDVGGKGAGVQGATLRGSA